VDFSLGGEEGMENVGGGGGEAKLTPSVVEGEVAEA
jgi:hypothetical protein